ncbi:type II toxin-antitoxin system VapB family antitoxin [Micromonospora arborensis]|uniref:type II toxin-antitoxin system VapB family antitoxin n=1 Tax=Micromonospora arborensis TaxID=2116518 RepID=UPI001FCA427B|nr:type II toxin-antitoxin system VapB family antitoxin [Micromonospora arborensis]
MTRITVDVNDEWLDAARDVLGTDTKVATINAALHSFAVRRQAREIVAAFDQVEISTTRRAACEAHALGDTPGRSSGGFRTPVG